MTSPNYTSLVDDIVEIADRLDHAQVEVDQHSAEYFHLVNASNHVTTLYRHIKQAQKASVQGHIDEIIDRARQGTATNTDMQRIRKALENFYD